MDTTPSDLFNDLFRTADALTTADPSEGAFADLAHRLAIVRGTIGLLQEIADTIAQSLASDMESDTMTVSGVGVLTRKPRYSSVWTDDEARERMFDDAAREIVRQTATDPMTGEVYPPIANAVKQAWTLVLEAFSIGADPKVAFRKKLGLQPDEYRSRYVTGHTVTIGEETK